MKWVKTVLILKWFQIKYSSQVLQTAVFPPVFYKRIGYHYLVFSSKLGPKYFGVRSFS